LDADIPERSRKNRPRDLNKLATKIVEAGLRERKIPTKAPESYGRRSCGDPRPFLAKGFTSWIKASHLEVVGREPGEDRDFELL
jgi:hypothetical protein